jgi:hypothetical protein
MMSLRLWDFATCACGRTHRDWPIDAPRIPKTIRCECGQRVGWLRQRSRAQVHRSLSTLYGEHRTDPQTGETYLSYEDKKRKLKAAGLEEGEVERVDDIMAEEGRPASEPDPNVGRLDADSDEEAHKQLLDMVYQDPRVDRKNSGTPRERLLDSWGSFEPGKG